MTEVISEVRFGDRGDFFHEPDSKCWEVTDSLLVFVIVNVCLVDFFPFSGNN